MTPADLYGLYAFGGAVVGSVAGFALGTIRQKVSTLRILHNWTHEHPSPECCEETVHQIFYAVVNTRRMPQAIQRRRSNGTERTRTTSAMQLPWRNSQGLQRLPAQQRCAHERRPHMKAPRPERTLRISELIAVLQERLSRHGDLPVLATWEGIVRELSPAHVYAGKDGGAPPTADVLYIDADDNDGKDHFALDPTEGESGSGHASPSGGNE